MAAKAISGRAHPDRTKNRLLWRSFPAVSRPAQWRIPQRTVRRGYSGEKASPPARVARARQTSTAVPEENARTEPSAIAAFTNPG